ncbi:MAG: exo-alpha-sialidase [Clostridiales bacterium]|nr:exo-alpha-sialidase [Clostridiales bacterium]
MYKEVTPTIIRNGIISRLSGMYGYHGWPSVARDEKGVLYAVCSGFRAAHVCPFGKTVMFVSRDDGETWTPPIVVNDTPLDDRDAGIVCLGNNKLLITWFAHPTEVYLHTYANGIKNSMNFPEANVAMAQLATFYEIPDPANRGGSFVRLSRDGGVTWGDTVQLPVSAPHGPILRSDGSLLYLGKELYSEKWPNPELPHAVVAYSSRDDGMTWQRLGAVDIPEGYTPHNFHEPHSIELKDGSILGVIRAEREPVKHGFSIFKTISKDGGLTWSPMEQLDVCGSPPHLLRHSSGAIICAFGRRIPPFGERALVSYDEGKTWEEYILRTDGPDGDLGYPASVELDDGSILTVFYQKYAPGEKCSFLYTRWKL